MFITIIYEDPHPLLHEVPGNVYYNSEYILPQDPYTREKFGLLESTAGLHPLLHEVSLYYIIPLLLYDYNDITFVVLLLSSLLLLYVYMYIHNNIYIYIYIYICMKVSIHTCTKYLGGHSDVLAGSVTARGAIGEENKRILYYIIIL